MATLDLSGLAVTEVERFIKVERTANNAINLVFLNQVAGEVRITVYDGKEILIPYGRDLVLKDKPDDRHNLGPSRKTLMNFIDDSLKQAFEKQIQYDDTQVKEK